MKKYKRWTKEELDYIRENYQKHKDKELAVMLSEKFGSEVTIDMLRRQRRNIGTKKNRGRMKNEDNIRSDSIVPGS